jgi:hypothetical protein
VVSLLFPSSFHEMPSTGAIEWQLTYVLGAA